MQVIQRRGQVPTMALCLLPQAGGVGGLTVAHLSPNQFEW